MAAVHQLDPSKKHALPPISEMLPLFSPHHGMLSQSIYGLYDQITNPKQRAQYPLVDRPPATNPGSVQLGHLPPRQIFPPNGPSPPERERGNALHQQIYAEPPPEAGNQYGVATGRDGNSNPESCEHFIRLLRALDRILEDLDSSIQNQFTYESPQSEQELDDLIRRAEKRFPDSLEQVRNSVQRSKSAALARNMARMDSLDKTRAGNLNGGKKRHRRPAPASRCHSCDRIDTPEWRRGPDGARTLCNACGLRYAKERKPKLKAQ